MENRKKRIAIIEDEGAIAEMIAEFCQELGFDVLLLSDEEDILERVKAYAPDLITLDLIMPNFSGLEIMEKLKKDDQTKTIPIIVISAIASNEFKVVSLLNIDRIKKPNSIQIHNVAKIPRDNHIHPAHTS